MTNCNKDSMSFTGLNGKKVDANFDGGKISSEGGSLFIREMDEQLKLTENAAKLIPDARDQSKVRHSVLTMVRQRVYGIAQGYEDLNDHDILRKDPAFLTALGGERESGSSPALCRFENSIDRETNIELRKLMVGRFMDSFKSPPKKLTLDFDPTDDIVHGNQEGRFFNGHYCFPPLYVFCGSQLLVSYLRPSNIDGAKHSWAILAPPVKAFRKRRPKVEIIFRADSGFFRHRIFNWCEKHGVRYIVGAPANQVLSRKSFFWKLKARFLHMYSQSKERCFGEFSYGAKTWKKERRVIVKAEHNHRGANTRYVVTNMKEKAEELYDDVYCLRGKMEQLIGEQLSFASDRTSCHEWQANQFRLTLASLAYILVDSLRRFTLAGTELANSQVSTIRLKLLKIGALVIRNTRRIIFKLSENNGSNSFACPIKRLYLTISIS